VRSDEQSRVQGIVPVTQADIWINGGFSFSSVRFSTTSKQAKNW
jgi:hypothetical protein